MKKVVVVLTLIIILFNFIFCNSVYAEGAESISGESKMVNILAVDNATPENGFAQQELEGDTEENENFGATIMGAVVGLLAGAINLLAFQFDLIMGQLTFSTEEGKLNYFFSIERAVFNRIPLFNINFFEMGDTYKVGIEGANQVEIESSAEVNAIKDRVAKMFRIIQIIATGLSLVVLLYIGIRMALSTLSDDKAKYKKMLIGWVESVVILFLLEYIMVAVIMFGEMLTNLFYDLEIQLLSTAASDESFELVIRERIWTALFDSSGLDYAMNTVMYICLLFLQLKYFWTYLKRVLMVGFLIMIAPLITVTYGIDKAGDGKAQAFSIWMKEFVVNVLIQPLHALIYLIFVLSAGEIAKVSPIIALAFIMAMGVVERMVKIIFDLKGLVSLRGVNKLGKH